MKPASGMVTATGPRKLRALVAGGALRSLNARIPARARKAREIPAGTAPWRATLR